MNTVKAKLSSIIILLTIIMGIFNISNIAYGLVSMGISISIYEDAEKVAWYTEEPENTNVSYTSIINEEVVPNKEYSKNISFSNDGIDLYMRMIVNKYFVDSENRKSNVSPEFIKIYMNDKDIMSKEEMETEDWILLEKASTIERVVLYYKKIVHEETKKNIEFSFIIDSKIMEDVEFETKTTSDNSKVITFSRKNEDLTACIEVKFDTVQTQRAQDVMWTVWGVRPTIGSDGVITAIE